MEYPQLTIAARITKTTRVLRNQWNRVTDMEMDRQNVKTSKASASVFINDASLVLHATENDMYTRNKAISVISAQLTFSARNSRP